MALMDCREVSASPRASCGSGPCQMIRPELPGFARIARIARITSLSSMNLEMFEMILMSFINKVRTGGG